MIYDPEKIQALIDAVTEYRKGHNAFPKVQAAHDALIAPQVEYTSPLPEWEEFIWPMSDLDKYQGRIGLGGTWIYEQPYKALREHFKRPAPAAPEQPMGKEK